MDVKELVIKIKEIIEPVIKDMGMSLEDVELTKMAGKVLLRIFIDKEGGVTLDDCEQVSREVEAQLDVEDPIPCSYILEVSSPGIDRPLRNPADFRRFCGKMARVVTSKPIENQTFFIGEIVRAGDIDIELLLPKDKRITIPYKDISRARLEVNF
jgi:ribosome maturation factor RimP